MRSLSGLRGLVSCIAYYEDDDDLFFMTYFSPAASCQAYW